ncbi:MAG TPA: hypothetical protein VK673_05560 [Chthoniobacterales bacterium]|nr:hypothetical protein [Chthoniobacterales bacterium]
MTVNMGLNKTANYVVPNLTRDQPAEGKRLAEEWKERAALKRGEREAGGEK